VQPGYHEDGASPAQRGQRLRGFDDDAADIALDQSLPQVLSQPVRGEPELRIPVVVQRPEIERCPRVTGANFVADYDIVAFARQCDAGSIERQRFRQHAWMQSLAGCQVFLRRDRADVGAAVDTLDGPRHPVAGYNLRLAEPRRAIAPARQGDAFNELAIAQEGAPVERRRRPEGALRKAGFDEYELGEYSALPDQLNPEARQIRLRQIAVEANLAADGASVRDGAVELELEDPGRVADLVVADLRCPLLQLVVGNRVQRSVQ